MSNKTSSKSIVFTSDRGNDIYSRTNEMIRIKIEPSSCAMLNTKASFLRYSLKINFDGCPCIPDPKILHPFKNIFIYDGNESTLLEQLNHVEITHALRNYYGLSENDERLQSIFEGRGQNNKGFVESLDESKAINNNRGGGFQSQFRNFEATQLVSNVSRKAEMIYNFPLSGILGKDLNYVFPVIAVNGLVIRLELMDAKQYLVKQFTVLENNDRTLNGYGIGDGTQNVDVGVSHQADQRGYEFFTYIDAAGNEVAPAAALPAHGTGFTGILLKHTGATKGANVTDIKNCSFMPGSTVNVGSSAFTAAGLPIPNKLVSVKMFTCNDGDQRVLLDFGANIDPARAAAGTATSPVINNTNLTAEPSYEVSDVQFIANAVQTDPQLVQEMVAEFQAGRVPLPIKSYHVERVNLTTGALNNEINIPCNKRFVYSVIASNEVNRAFSIDRSDVTPDITNLSDYQFVLDSINTPNLPISLRKVSAGRVDALHIKEVEKALKETSIDVKNLLNPSNHLVIGRRLGVYTKSGLFDGTYDCIEKPIKLRVNYHTAQAQNLVYNCIFFYYKQIRQEGMRRIVIE